MASDFLAPFVALRQLPQHRGAENPAADERPSFVRRYSFVQGGTRKTIALADVAGFFRRLDFGVGSVEVVFAHSIRIHVGDFVLYRPNAEENARREARLQGTMGPCGSRPESRSQRGRGGRF